MFYYYLINKYHLFLREIINLLKKNINDTYIYINISLYF